LASQRDKHLLRDILGEVNIARDSPKTTTIDEIQVPAHELGERILRPFRDKAPEQQEVVTCGRVAHSMDER